MSWEQDCGVSAAGVGDPSRTVDFPSTLIITNMSYATYAKLYTLFPHSLGTCRLENTRIASENHLLVRVYWAADEDLK